MKKRKLISHLICTIQLWSYKNQKYQTKNIKLYHQSINNYYTISLITITLKLKNQNGQQHQWVVINQSDKKICYAISTEKLCLETKQVTNQIGGSIDAGYQNVPSAKVGLNANHKSVTDFKGKQIQSLVAVKSNCFSTIGLQKLESEKVRINLWVGDEKQIEELLLRDVEVKTEKDIRHLVNFKLEVTRLSDHQYEQILKGNKIYNNDYKQWRLKDKLCMNGHKLEKYVKEKAPGFPYKGYECTQCKEYDYPYYFMGQTNSLLSCFICDYHVCKKCELKIAS